MGTNIPCGHASVPYNLLVESGGKKHRCTPSTFLQPKHFLSEEPRSRSPSDCSGHMTDVRIAGCLYLILLFSSPHQTISSCASTQSAYSISEQNSVVVPYRLLKHVCIKHVVGLAVHTQTLWNTGWNWKSPWKKPWDSGDENPLIGKSGEKPNLLYSLWESQFLFWETM